MTDLPEHNCDPRGEHCLGCCPGGCGKRMHEPPRDGLVWHGLGLWSAPSGSGGPNSTPRRMTLYYDNGGPSIGGPSR